MRGELVPIIPSRPMTVMFEGWREFIVVHDAYYLRTKANWKRRMTACHPDNGGDPWWFRAKHDNYLRWRRAEIKYYGKRGMFPPDNLSGMVWEDQRKRTFRLPEQPRGYG